MGWGEAATPTSRTAWRCSSAALPDVLDPIQSTLKASAAHEQASRWVIEAGQVDGRYVGPVEQQQRDCKEGRRVNESGCESSMRGGCSRSRTL